MEDINKFKAAVFLVKRLRFSMDSRREDPAAKHD